MKLGEYIYRDLEKNPYLLILYTNLLKQYASVQFKIKNESNLEESNIIDLLKFADLLSKSTNLTKNQYHKNIAQNIVILLNKLYPNNINVKATFISVLNSINNYRNIDDDNYYDGDIREFIYQYIEKQSFRIDENDDKYFIRDQKEIYNKLENERYFSYSGPTSMGKTFVIKVFIQKKIKNEEEKNNFVIVVPTKALIGEITSELITEIGDELKEKNYKIINSYNEMQEDMKCNYIMVYTQERFLAHLLKKNIDIGYVFIDEAHKLFYEDSRSVYFYKILDILSNYSNMPKIFFSAPLISNPDEFLKLLPATLSKTYRVFEFSPVNQQKYILDYNGKNIVIFNDLTKTFIEINDNNLEYYNLNTILRTLGEEQKNLIYCENPKDAIEMAKDYAEIKATKVQNEKVEKVKKYIKNEIHESYYLIDLLDRGIAYHVGYVPNSIRKKIESLYRDKEIDTIFCTSTLLEGINLPADNLFIPVKENSKILKNDIDFKNLIGRVGRIKYNLSGNVFIIPKDGQKTVNKCTKIVNSEINDRELSIKTVLTEERKIDIIENLKKGSTELNKKCGKTCNNTEYEFSRYIMNVLIDDILNNRKSNIYKEFEKKIDKKTKETIVNNFKKEKVPQDMAITLDQVKTIESEIDNELEYPEQINYKTILEFLKKLYKQFMWWKYEPKNELGSENVLNYYSTILNQWINGAYISQIIKNSIEYAEKSRVIYSYGKKEEYSGSVEQINIIINQTLDTIEKIIKFKIENYFSKFSELYKKRKGIDKIENDWYEYLSYGTNKKEIIELQKMGFSREIALKIYRMDKYIIFDTDSIFLSTKIFEDENEDIVEEAKEVSLNNYNKFK